MRRPFCLLVAALAALAACRADAAEALIGFANPLTGAFAATGSRYRTAVELAVEDLNRQGGVLGRTVKVVAADDVCGVDQAVTAAQQLVDAGAGFVVGHLCSHSSLMAAAVYEAAGVVMMTPSSSHPRLTEEGRGNIFRLSGRDDQQGRMAGNFLAERWPERRIAILHDGSTYGEGLAAQTRQRLRQRGAVETLYDVFTPGQQDYAALAGRLQRAGIELLYIGGYGADAARILLALRARDDGLQLVGGQALGMDEFWAITGQAGNGTLFTARQNLVASPESEAIMARFRARGLGERPLGVGGYAAVQVWAQAVERAGTFDPAAVARMLHRGRFDSVLGRVAFDAKGDLEGATWQWQMWRDGNYEPVPEPRTVMR
jgi:branched-chain amino acid transport system substrate-binding protein